MNLVTYQPEKNILDSDSHETEEKLVKTHGHKDNTMTDKNV